VVPWITSILDRIEAASPITVRPEMNDALCFLVTVTESSHREFYILIVATERVRRQRLELAA
jgi:DNA-binding MarR family transcriptional regulator